MLSPDISNANKTVEFKRAVKTEAETPTNSEVPNLQDPALYINRELSLLAFQWRVLEEAQDANNPLLERFRFLAILGSNLDEFFMVRVAGLKRQVEAGSLSTGPDGMTPQEQLEAISSEVGKLRSVAQDLLEQSLLPALKEADIHVLKHEELTQTQQQRVKEFFLQKIFPVLTPLAFDPSHPFPHISNLSLSMAVTIQNKDGEERFARVKIPNTLPQLIPILPDIPPEGLSQVSKQQSFIWLEDLVKSNLEVLFPGMTILDAHPFHVTRDAEVEIQEWEAADLLEETEEGIRQRRFGDVTRLQVARAMPANILEILMSNLQVEPADVYLVEDRMPLSSLKYIAGLDRPDLKYPPFMPTIPNALNPDIQEEDLFSIISRRDYLLHHPYDSFQPIVNFLNLAAEDPQVLAIKATLYRVGRNSPVVQALLKACERGKEVAVLVELKARFDEESNIEWAKALEREGVHVVYGLLGLKIHSKTALVVRREGDVIRRYVHVGTGNYNTVTAHQYTDLGLFTANEQIGADATDLFNYLTGYSDKKDYRQLLVAPINLRERFEELIQREIEHQKAGKKGHLIFKMNSLVDERIIQLLYEASRAGVRIDLLVRGICGLRPGIPGISENIRVRSVVGRFLEHSRIYYFRNGGDEETYIGSADLMPRNLNRRVEVIIPVLDPRLSQFLQEDVLAVYWQDNVSAREMQADGNYVRITPEDTEKTVGAQSFFLNNNSSQWRAR